MEEYKIKANEQFFELIIAKLNEGGIYGWVAQGKTFVKKNGKLVAQDTQTYLLVKKIVSPEYHKKRFALPDSLAEMN